MTDCLQHHGDAAGHCGAVHISVGKRKGAAEAMAEAKNAREEVAGDRLPETTTIIVYKSLSSVLAVMK